MPFVRNVVAQWQPRNCDPMVDFLDSWAPIIPVWILDNILDQLIFPKLQKEVGDRALTQRLLQPMPPDSRDGRALLTRECPTVLILAFSGVLPSCLPQKGIHFPCTFGEP